MESLFLRILTLSAVCGAVLLPLLLLGRHIRHRYAARTMYVLWLLMALRLILPFQFQLSAPVVTVEAPAYTFELPAAPAAPAAPAFPGAQAGTAGVGLPDVGAPAAPAAAPSTASLTEILAAVWLAGAAFFAAWQICSYLLTRRALLRPSAPAGEELRAALDGLRAELGVGRTVGLRVTARVASPVMLGLFRPVVLLPEGEEVPPLVLRHELCHLKRLDVAYKGLMLLANAVHWFNPLVWWMAREAGRNLELCCDEAVLRGVPAEGRRAYGEILLRTAAGGASPAFSTRFGSGKKQLRERLQNLFQQKRTGAALVCTALVLAFALGSLVACESGSGDAAPLSPADALAELEDSVTFDPETGNLSFVIPAGYTPATDWSIHVAGRMAMGEDGGGMSLHYFDGERWQPANAYTIGFTKEQIADFTELNLDAALPDPEAEDLGGERRISVDLLAVVRASATLYINETFGFTLQLPPSWAGRYTVSESADGRTIVFGQSGYEAVNGEHGWEGIEGMGVVFWLTVADTAQFEADYSGNYEELSPAQSIVFGTVGDNTVYADFVSDVRWDEDREAEYQEMERDARGLVKTAFAAAPTARTDPPAVDRTDLEACIGDAILQAQSWHVDNDLPTQAHVTLKTEESGTRTMVYAMAEYLGFIGGPSGFEQSQGGIMPVALTFEKNAAGEYSLVEYWMPVDGEGYWASIRETFPADVGDRDLDTQTYVEALTRECYAQAVAHWNVDTGPIVDALLETICAAPGVTADPDTFPDGARRELRYYGQYTLDYCMGEFEKGGQTGLKGTVMAAVCRELLGPQAEGLTVPDETGQTWYEAYSVQEMVRALMAERPNYTVMRMERHGEYFVVTAREEPDDVVGYWAPTAFVLARQDGAWSIAAELRCDPALTPGFSASVLHAGGMTVVVGDLGDKLLLPGPLDEEGIRFSDFEETDVVLVTDGGDWGGTFRKGGDILFVVDGTVEVSDLIFSVDGERVTSYLEIYHEPPEASSQR